MGEIRTKSADAGRKARLEVFEASTLPVVSPSLLNCDFSRMAEELSAVKEAGASVVHLDVMDGHFVPNLSYGAPVIAEWRKRSDLTFDAHLMISDPARYLDDFIEAGCDIIVFHIEAVPEPRELAERIRRAGCQAGISLNPPTPLDAILPYVEFFDCVLVMSVMPGFGGQAFDPTVLEKVRHLRLGNPSLRIAIDGGIKAQTAAEAVAAGVTQLVAGSAVFRPDGDYRAALNELYEGVRHGLRLRSNPTGDVPPPPQ